MVAGSPRMKLRVNWRSLPVYFALFLICAVCLIPVVWAVSSSLKTREELYTATPSLIPHNPTLLNYTWMLTRADMSRLPLNMINSADGDSMRHRHPGRLRLCAAAIPWA